MPKELFKINWEAVAKIQAVWKAKFSPPTSMAIVSVTPIIEDIQIERQIPEDYNLETLACPYIRKKVTEENASCQRDDTLTSQIKEYLQLSEEHLRHVERKIVDSNGRTLAERYRRYIFFGTGFQGRRSGKKTAYHRKAVRQRVNEDGDLTEKPFLDFPINKKMHNDTIALIWSLYKNPDQWNDIPD